MNNGKLILAPMQGLTELLFRQCYEHCFPGAIDLAVSPFLSLTHGNLADAWKKIDDVWPEANQNSIPVIPQILGKESIEFIDLANRLGEVGYTEVNWNIGCPMRRVAAKHRGSGILPYPEEIEDILSTIIPKLKVRLSIKMRLGYYNNDEILKIIPILNQYPLASITIHPRNGKQQYGGQVDLATLDQVAPLLHHKIIYNGDVCTPEYYNMIRARYPIIEDVMIGRGVLYDPLLPLKIKQLPYSIASAYNFVSTLIHNISCNFNSDEARVRKTKEYWVLLSKSLPISEQEAREVLHQSTLADTQEKIKKIIESI